MHKSNLHILPAIVLTVCAAASAGDTAELWSLRPPSSVAVPVVEGDTWSANEIDRFILRRLAEASIRPSPPADRHTLVRRLFFDLLGLPPAPHEVEAFIADRGPGAYERLVHRLLDDPRYGERQARIWLDLVRYAESDGYKADLYRPDAWRYRDYVIRSFNADKPYDRFIQEQLAGDELFPGDPDALVGTGYLRLWPYEDNQADVARQWEAILTDLTNVTAEALLGLSLGCARCHDHKYDPITQKDYYSFQAFFAPILPRTDLFLATAQEKLAHDAKLAEWQAATASIRQQIDAIEMPAIDRKRAEAISRYPAYLQEMYAKSPDQRTPLEQQYVHLAEIQTVQRTAGFEALISADDRKRLQELKTQLKTFDPLKPAPLPPVLGIGDVGPQAPATYLPARPSDPIAPAFPASLGSAGAHVAPPAGNTTGRRAALACWITRPDHPLTARVVVNRIWQQHFGTGLVATPSDFGRQGAPPSHPELLDYLASRFVAEGWSFKKLHKLIVLSATYRQASVTSPPPRAREVDPQNAMLWRQRVRRLEAEQVRDAMLLVSGRLDPVPRGPAADYDQPVRSIYLKAIRNRPEDLLAAFDLPDMFNSCGRRSVTTTPLQSLMLINGAFTLDCAQAIGARLASQGPADPSSLVDRAYRAAVGRGPTDTERSAAMSLFSGAPDEQALTDLCHVLLNSNAFIYVD